jgi:hypothetical protein
MIFKAAPPSIWSKRFGSAVLKAVDDLLKAVDVLLI